MSRSSKLSRNASLKSALTGMISIAASMGSCPPAPVIGHDPGDLDRRRVFSRPTSFRRRYRAGATFLAAGTALLAAVDPRAVLAIGPGDPPVQPLAGGTGAGLTVGRVGDEAEGPMSDGGVPGIVDLASRTRVNSRGSVT